MTQPDDRELEQYLEGGSKLSRRYREASGETSPPDFDEAILARARAELGRKPSLNRMLTPLAVAASLLLGVNLAWNLYQAEPLPGDTPLRAGKKASDDFVPNPPPQPQSKARAPAMAEAPRLEERLENDAGLAAPEEEKRLDVAQDEQRAATAREQAAQSQRREKTASRDAAAPHAYSAPSSAAPSSAAAPTAALADAAPMSEGARIDHLINHIRMLEGAVFIRNGKEYGPAEAAKHLQYKRERAGDRIKTANDFIRLCAVQSFVSGEIYQIRFADGRTRTAEDVLREELARISP